MSDITTIAEINRLIVEANTAIGEAAGRCANGEEISAIITAERAIPRIADALGHLAKLSPNTMGTMDCTGLGFKLDAKYHILWGAGTKTDVGAIDLEMYSEIKGTARYVIRYALDHYNEDGWDILIETVPKMAVALVCCDITDKDEALKVVAEKFGITIAAERRSEIQAEADG